MSHKYGQWCPIAKSMEILGEKWTMLIVRELLMGSTRFSDLQRGLGTISPTLLTRRLVTLEEYDLVYKRRIQGGRGHEYLPTPSCKKLQPILLHLGNWGMEWSKAFMSEADYDVELLMLYLQRSVVTDKGQHTVLAETGSHWSDCTGLHPLRNSKVCRRSESGRTSR